MKLNFLKVSKKSGKNYHGLQKRQRIQKNLEVSKLSSYQSELQKDFKKLLLVKNRLNFYFYMQDAFDLSHLPFLPDYFCFKLIVEFGEKQSEKLQKKLN